ncbi:MAG: hypothetical protein QM757_45830 [Paludibaculum sp.]
MEEQEHSLIFRAEETSSWLQAATAAIAAGGIVGFVASTFGVSIPLLVLAAAATTALAFKGARWPSHAELRVTNLEYVTRGPQTSNWFQSENRIPRAGVRWLEYREDQSGPESGAVGGLYAKGKYSAACLLPFIDEAQAIDVIERIEARFVSVGEQRTEESPFGRNFTRLNLDDR